MGDRCKGPGSVAEYGGHDGRAATEEAGGSVTAAGELATGTAALSLAGKLYHAAYVVRPGRYFAK